MGAGVSSSAAAPPASSTGASVSKLAAPWNAGDDMCFPVIPHEDFLRKKSPTLVLEVGFHGFRLLRPQLMDPVLVFPWGQIHSWSHSQPQPTEALVSLRFFDDSKHAIEQVNLSMRDVEPLLEHIQGVVESILMDRKNNVVSAQEFEAILESLRRAQAAPSASTATPVEIIAQHVPPDRFFMSDQGRAALDLCPTSFDKIELAVLLHARLVDQSRFSYVLDGIPDPAERDNVWARITSAKKAPHLYGGGGSGVGAPGSPSALRSRSSNVALRRTESSTGGGTGVGAGAATAPAPSAGSLSRPSKAPAAAAPMSP